MDKALYIVCRSRVRYCEPTPVWRPAKFPSSAFIARSFWLVPGTDPEDPFYVEGVQSCKS